MNYKPGDTLRHTLKPNEYRGSVKVVATVLQVYPAIYDPLNVWEMTITYKYLGDTITEHGLCAAIF